MQHGAGITGRYPGSGWSSVCDRGRRDTGGAAAGIDGPPAPDADMWLVFQDAASRSFCMKDAPLSLDMLFFDAQRHLIAMQLNVPPCRQALCPLYPSGAPWRRAPPVASGSKLAIWHILAACPRASPPVREIDRGIRPIGLYPYLLRELQIERLNQVWADVTYIPMAREFLYLVAIIDWHSRKVLSWQVSNTMDADFCVEALQEALSKYGQPEIFNTDQGSQFASRGLHFGVT